MPTTDKSSKGSAGGESIQADRELESMSTLWRHVLLQALKDIFHADLNIRRDVNSWFNSRASVEQVCDFAMISSEDIADCVVAIYSMKTTDAEAYCRVLCKAILHGQRLPTPERVYQRQTLRREITMQKRELKK